MLFRSHMLGLDEQEESVYSVIPLSVEATNWSASRLDENVTAGELKLELAPINTEHYERSQRIREYPMLTAMNSASMLDSTRLFQGIQSQPSKKYEDLTVALPRMERLEYDFAEACKNRYSSGMDFVLRKVSQQQLATLLQEAMSSFSYRNDLDQTPISHESRVSIYGCFYNVEDIPNGAYFYDRTEHALREIGQGDHRLHLQSGMSMDNVNLLQVPLCLHVAGNKDFYKNELGYRGYRILQMEAGMLLQRLLIAASAIGFGGHALLGFDANLSDELYKMGPKGETSLIQIPIGPYQPRPWLRGSLHS